MSKGFVFYAQIHLALAIGKYSEVYNFVSDKLRIGLAVIFADAKINKQPGIYLADYIAVNRYQCVFHSLNYRSHCGYVMRIFVYRQRRKKIPALKENAGKGKRKLMNKNNMALLVFLGLSPY
jgi:hypothetical protein